MRRLGALAVVHGTDETVSATLLDAANKPGPRLSLALDPEHAALIRCTFEVGSASTSANTPAPGDLALAAAWGLELHLAAGGMRLRWPQHNLDLPLQVRWLEEGDGTLVAVEVTGDLQPNEALVGFGERYDAVDQRGRTLDTIVYEQYKNHGNRSYLPVPFFLSNCGYGCHVEGTDRVHYDLGHTVPDRWRCLAYTGSQEQIAVDLFGGEPLAILHAFVALAGRPSAPPPDWVFGPWMSSNEWNTQAARRTGVGQDARTGHSRHRARHRGVERRNHLLHLERRPVHAEVRRRHLPSGGLHVPA